MNDTIRENIDFLQEKLESANTLMECSYRDAVISFEKNNTIDADDAIRLYEEIHDGSSPRLSHDFAVFCKVLSDTAEITLTLSYDSVTENQPESEQSQSRIAYLRNTFSDRAFKAFAKKFDKVSAVYFPGSREVLEEVYYNRASHAIIPILNSSDGMLLSFYKLFLKYDLRIVSSYDTEMNDESLTRYALLTKGITSDTVRELSHSEHRKFLDIFAVFPENETLGGFISACEYLGASAVTVNSIPLEYASDKYGIIVHLDISSCNIDALLLLFEGSRIRYDTLGIYDII